MHELATITACVSPSPPHLYFNELCMVLMHDISSPVLLHGCFLFLHFLALPSTHYALVHVQEQCSRRDIEDLQQQLQSSETLVAEFQKTLNQRDSELETLKQKSVALVR